MKHAALPALLLALAVIAARSAEPAGGVRAKQSTLVAIVRHAEKAEGDDPGLTPAGKERAERLARAFARARVDALIGSDLRRTHETLAPLARAKKVRIEKIKEPAAVARAIRALPGGSFAVVAHHSNTVREILEALGVPPEATGPIAVDEHDNLLIAAWHPELEPRVWNLTY
jgi:hypothetical protein